MTEIHGCGAKGRCLFVTAAVDVGEVLLREFPLVASSPTSSPDSWSRLHALHEASPLPCEPQWYLAAAAVLSAAAADQAVEEAVADKCVPEAWPECGGRLVEADAPRALGALGIPSEAARTLAAAVAVMQFNAFQLQEPGALGLYERTSMIAHSCCPSASFALSERDELIVTALKSMKAGEEITISYLEQDCLLQSTPQRRQRLEGWLFTCHCERCSWPADLSRGFRCLDPDCPGVCFMPNPSGEEESEDAEASLPCSACGEVIRGPALDWSVEQEDRLIARLGRDAGTASFEALDEQRLSALAVFKRHWLLAALEAALLRLRSAQGDKAAAEADREERAAVRTEMLAPWPWLV